MPPVNELEVRIPPVKKREIKKRKVLSTLIR
jgi:hypothetical protein